MRTWLLAAMLNGTPIFATSEVEASGRIVFTRDQSLARRFDAETRPTERPVGFYGLGGVFRVRNGDVIETIKEARP